MKAVSLRVLQGEIAVWKLPPDAAPPELGGGPLLSITKTAAELSVVGPAEQAPEGVPVESGWSCLEVQGPLDFDLTGILAGISAPLAAAAIPIFAISTFETDYILVRRSDLERTVAALEEAGYAVGAAIKARV